ncbi:4Fe-4S dicluster domain-containing protein [Methanobrevibacter oralis]|uniref:Electron transport complex subunit RsxB n=1 Tax=Methanobrevibacter oralis TaxID=66851 RepID=A0A166BI74_METOA|nr:4Fe-4S dicluster domain-containing protein [Methanobrevibacter oralis]KZX13386.1 electron transport complex subunit RsxB [Methanobrevibacter oralis]
MIEEEISYPVIHKEECKGCGRCILGCPQNAIALSDELNKAGYQYAYYKGHGCTGCKDCFFTCPEPLALEVHSYKNIVNNEIGKMIKYKANKR